MKKGKKSEKVSKEEEIQRWFLKSVTYEGEAYTIDLEQAKAVVSERKNVIVVARAGSGKTRTIVAKIIYLVAKCGIKPEEIMAFVFNANAAAEINARLNKMRVDGKNVINEAKIANTFHAFSRKTVYEIYGGGDKCGRILGDEKEGFVARVIEDMLRERKWQLKIRKFIGVEPKEKLEDEELASFVRVMATFINRAQQKYLAGENTLRQSVQERLRTGEIHWRERGFIELGAECYRRYHWYLLKGTPRQKGGFFEYGTDFNLIMAWAGKLIRERTFIAKKLLFKKKYLLIDEYQDFSQLFLSVVMAIRVIQPEIKLFVVGDDWQAINRFAGSEVEYFKNFERFFTEESERLEISTNYRCDYRIVEAARKFMKRAMAEKGNFRAFSRKAGRVLIVNPVVMDMRAIDAKWQPKVKRKDLIYFEMAKRASLEKVPEIGTACYMKTIVEIVRENKGRKILILHRNNEMDLAKINLERLRRALRWGLERMGEGEVGDLIEVMTMHKSKGLEAEVVIILEADVGVIPKTHPDTSLYQMFGETEEMALDDQKRLFYVAMTRARKKLYIIHTKSRDEGFVGFLGKGVEEWGK